MRRPTPAPADRAPRAGRPRPAAKSGTPLYYAVASLLPEPDEGSDARRVLAHPAGVAVVVGLSGDGLARDRRNNRAAIAARKR